MKKQPLVSVIMPAYNSKGYIRDAIQSILKQTYQNVELLIVDDCSTDGTSAIIADYAQRFSPIIRAVFLKKHMGDNATANKGFAKAKGSFIARMDADDIAHPQRIQKQVDFLQKHPKVLVVGTQGYVINKDNAIIGEKKFPLLHQDIYQQFGIYNPMLHPSCMFRRSLLPNPHKLYHASKSIHDDYYTFFSYLNCGTFANLDEKLLYYRIHGKNYSLTHPKKRFREIQRIRRFAVRQLFYHMSLKAKILNMVQGGMVALLPEKAIVPCYMFLQGMYSPLNALKKRFGYVSSPSLILAQEA